MSLCALLGAWGCASDEGDTGPYAQGENNQLGTGAAGDGSNMSAVSPPVTDTSQMTGTSGTNPTPVDTSTSPGGPDITPTPADTPPADTPPADTPPANTPPANTPPANTPPANTPPADAPPADTPPADTPPADTPPDFQPPSGDGCLMGGGDYMNEGPYSIGMMDVNDIGGQGPYTIFYPTNMQDGCHPMVAWGNGTGVTGSGVYAFYQQHAASYGIVVVASHNSNTGTGAFHKAAIDWALAQNEDSSSMFYGKLNGRAGTSGHSQGGAGANAGSSHPAVEAIGNVQGAFGIAPAGKAFLCLTGTEDIATEGCRTSVNSASSPALYANWDGGDHFGTATLGGFIVGDAGSLQYRRLYTAWFRCFLGDDANACSMFMGGESCPVCQESGWAEIFAKNF